MSITRLAALQKASAETHRRIYASLPFSVRFANMMVVLAAVDSSGWGRTLLMVMLREGVTGFEPIEGQPAADWAAAKKFNPSRLPHGYADAEKFGGQLYHEALMAIGNPSAAAEFLQELVLAMWSGAGSVKFKSGQNVFQAKGYLFNVARTRAKNWRRDKMKDEQRGVALEETDEEGHVRNRADEVKTDRDLSEHSHEIEKLLHHPEVIRNLKKIHEDAPLYIDFLLDGLTDKDIVTDGMLPHFPSRVPFSWSKTYKPKIFQVLNKAFEELL